MAVLASSTANPSKDTLPNEMPLLVHNLSSDLPTHVLAIHASQQTSTPNTGKSKVTLFPIHAIILAAFCASLPALPHSRPTIPDTFDSSSQSVTISIPVIPLSLPSPELFPLLCTFLYTRRTDHLLSSLLSCPSMTSGADDDSIRRSLYLLARRLAVERSIVQLLQSATKINLLWRNVCALGVFDEKLWCAMDMAWEVTLTALTFNTSRTRMAAPLSLSFTSISS